MSQDHDIALKNRLSIRVINTPPSVDVDGGGRRCEWEEKADLADTHLIFVRQDFIAGHVRIRKSQKKSRGTEKFEF